MLVFRFAKHGIHDAADLAALGALDDTVLVDMLKIEMKLSIGDRAKVIKAARVLAARAARAGEDTANNDKSLLSTANAAAANAAGASTAARAGEDTASSNNDKSLRLLSTGAAANAAGASAWFKAATGKLIIGPDGDVSLGRAGDGVLATPNDLHVDGNLGVGTAAPDAKLHVMGTIKAWTSNGGGRGFKVDGHQREIAYYGGPTAEMVFSNRAVSHDANNIKFKFGGNTKMILTKGGGVGVGTGDTLADWAMLHVAGPLLGDSSITADGYLRVRAGGQDKVKLVGNGDSFLTGGSLGIGVEAPLAKLHVDGGVKIGDDQSACDGDKAGTLRFAPEDGLQKCEDDEWSSIAGGGKVTLAWAWTPSPGQSAWDGAVSHYTWGTGVVDKKGGESTPYHDGIWTRRTFEGDFRYLTTVTGITSNHKHVFVGAYDAASVGPDKQGCSGNADGTDVFGAAGGVCFCAHLTGVYLKVEGTEVYRDGTGLPHESFPYSVEVARIDGEYEVKLNGASLWTGTPSFAGAVRLSRSAANGAQASTEDVGWWTKVGSGGGLAVGPEGAACDSSVAGTIRYDALSGELSACVKVGSSYRWSTLAGGVVPLVWHASVASDWEGKTDKYSFSTGVVDKHNGEGSPYKDGITSVGSFSGNLRYLTTITAQTAHHKHTYFYFYKASLAGAGIHQSCNPDKTDQPGGICITFSQYSTGLTVDFEGARVYSGPSYTDSYPNTIELNRINGLYNVIVNGDTLWTSPEGVPEYQGAIKIGRSAGNGAGASTADVGWWHEEP